MESWSAAYPREAVERASLTLASLSSILISRVKQLRSAAPGEPLEGYTLT
jgi:hypothetical protein